MVLARLALTLALAAPLAGSPASAAPPADSAAPAAATARPPGSPALATRLVTPRRLTVGDPFDVELTLTRPDSARVIGPLADSLGVFLPAARKAPAPARAGRGRLVYRVSLAAFRTGRLPVPVFTFLVRTGARTDTLRSAPDTVTVASVLPAGMKEIHDLERPETFPNPWLRIVPLALLAAAALAWGAARVLRGLRRRRERAERQLPPWEQALQALDALPWREWLEAGQVKRYYYALSEVLKRYIERRFEFNAVEQTTTEILASMRAARTPMRDEVARFLTRSDYVKYAKTVPPEAELRSAIAEVRDFVERTRPAEPAPVAPAGAAATAGGEGGA